MQCSTLPIIGSDALVACLRQNLEYMTVFLEIHLELLFESMRHRNLRVHIDDRIPALGNWGKFVVQQDADKGLKV